MNIPWKKSRFTKLSIVALIGLVSYSVTNLIANEAYSQTEQALNSHPSHQNEIISQARLAQILAPIALYPDTLLSHILIASTYPLQVVQAHRWMEDHDYLTKKKLLKKAQKKDWDPSVITLVAFPNVLQRLNEDLDWTQELGDAFLQSEQRVLASIQTLRQQADNANSFNTMDNMSVKYVDQQIIIEPRYREVIYVPYYDPRIVYGPWRWHKHPPIYWNTTPYYSGVHIDLSHQHRHGHQRFYWGTGIQISFNYFFSAFHWRKHHVVVTSHHNSHYYRPKHRIITSHGAQRWHKKSHYKGRRHLPKYQAHHKKNRNILHHSSAGMSQQTKTRIKPHHRVEKELHISRNKAAYNQNIQKIRATHKVKNHHGRVVTKLKPKQHQRTITKQTKTPKRATHYKARSSQANVNRSKVQSSQHRSHDYRQKIK